MLARPSLLAAISAAFLLAPSAFACSCVCPDKLSRAQIASKAKERLAGVDVAFEGKVSSVTWHDGLNNGKYARVQIRPERIFKGTPGPQIEIIYYFSADYIIGSIRQFDFVPGQSIEVLANTVQSQVNQFNRSEYSAFGPEEIIAANGNGDCFGMAIFDRNELDKHSFDGLLINPLLSD